MHACASTRPRTLVSARTHARRVQYLILIAFPGQQFSQMRRNIAVYVHVPFLSELFCYCCYRLVQTAVMVALLTKVDIMHVDFKQRFCYFYQVLTKFEFA